MLIAALVFCSSVRCQSPDCREGLQAVSTAVDSLLQPVLDAIEQQVSGAQPAGQQRCWANMQLLDLQLLLAAAMQAIHGDAARAIVPAMQQLLALGHACSRSLWAADGKLGAGEAPPCQHCSRMLDMERANV